MAQISIPGGSGGTTLTITVTGTHNVEFANTFAALVSNASSFIDLSTGMTTTVSGGNGVTLYTVSQGGEDVTIPAGTGSSANNVYVGASGVSTVTGSGTGDSVMVASVNPEVTYIDKGGNNDIAFIDGNNTYIGDMSSGAGTDTIIGGTGFDTITTGIGYATVLAGTGNATITLNDSVSTPGAWGDKVFIDSGHAVVNANGLKDGVIITSGGQTVNGGSNALAETAVVIQPGGGGDVLNAGAGLYAIFDSAGGNMIRGSTGTLDLIAGQNVTDTINGGTGVTVVYGQTGDTIDIASSPTLASNYFVSGTGGETLDGATANGNLYIYGNPSDSTANDSFTGGNGNDIFFTGGGNETLTGGAGHNVFYVDSPSAAADITVTDFGSGNNNLVGFNGYSSTEVQNALNGETTVSSATYGVGVELKMNDGTTVTFFGVTSLNGHVI